MVEDVLLDKIESILELVVGPRGSRGGRGSAGGLISLVCDT
jgi:hypothetical protein